ncbi:sigma factor-like helix-turn-helix DNA-binding protein [Amycolatopsis sp. NPDC101161]|uniref:sigma factor-like helix-turn-helix DNA-binding protein n=1 Tax=Amycolatopsis sp. NPDC101161 TaxID=3363940 RepID=UPI00381701DB
MRSYAGGVKKPLSARHEDLADVVPDLEASALLSPEHYAEVAEAAQGVRALLAPLPEQQRMVMAYLMDGFNHREVAQAISTTPAAVAKAAARARASLKDRIHADRQSQEER